MASYHLLISPLISFLGPGRRQVQRVSLRKHTDALPRIQAKLFISELLVLALEPTDLHIALLQVRPQELYLRLQLPSVLAFLCQLRVPLLQHAAPQKHSLQLLLIKGILISQIRHYAIHLMVALPTLHVLQLPPYALHLVAQRYLPQGLVLLVDVPHAAVVARKLRLRQIFPQLLLLAGVGRVLLLPQARCFPHLLKLVLEGIPFFLGDVDIVDEPPVGLLEILHLLFNAVQVLCLVVSLPNYF